MARVLLEKHFTSLRPLDQAGENALSRFKQGDIVAVEIKKPRNIKFHRMYWSLITIVHENMDGDRYPTPEDLHAAIKIAAGIRTQIQLPDGTIGFIPGSTAFHKMDEGAFSEFFDKVCDLVATHFLPGISSTELRQEIEVMTGIRDERKMAIG